MITRTNRGVQAPQEIFITPSGNQALASGAFLTSTGINLASGQAGILSEDPNGTTLPNNLINAAITANGVQAIRVIQGTPNSAQLSQVNRFGINDAAYVKSAVLEADKIYSVSSTKPELGTYSMEYLTGFSAPLVEVDYKLEVILRSHQRDMYVGQGKLDSVTSTHAYNTLPAQPVDGMLQTLATKANRRSIWTTGTKEVIVFGIKAAGGAGTQVIGTIADGTTFTFQTDNGQVFQYKANLAFVASLQKAIAVTPALATAGIFPMNMSVAGAAANVDGLLVVGLEEPKAAAYDTYFNRKVRVTTTTNLTRSTQNAVSAAKDTVGSGEVVYDKWKTRHGLGVFNNNWISHPFMLNVEDFPSYITNSESVLYTTCIVEFKRYEENISTSKLTPHRLVIVLPASLTNPTANVNTPFVVSTGDATTRAALNTVLGGWITSASDSYNNVEYHGDATPAAIIPA